MGVMYRRESVIKELIMKIGSSIFRIIIAAVIVCESGYIPNSVVYAIPNTSCLAPRSGIAAGDQEIQLRIQLAAVKDFLHGQVTGEELEASRKEFIERFYDEWQKKGAYVIHPDSAILIEDTVYALYGTEREVYIVALLQDGAVRYVPRDEFVSILKSYPGYKNTIYGKVDNVLEHLSAKIGQEGDDRRSNIIMHNTIEANLKSFHFFRLIFIRY